MDLNFATNIVNLVMHFLFEELHPTISSHIPVLKMYIDKLILATPSDKLDNVRTQFNSYKRNIQFIIKMENYCKKKNCAYLVSR